MGAVGLALVVVIVTVLTLRHAPTLEGATATILPTPIPTLPYDRQQSYAASPPGPGSSCVQKNGHWYRDVLPSTSFFCITDGMHLRQADGATTFAELLFDWPGHPFPAQYTARIKLSSLAQPSSCAGLGVLRHVNQGYIAYICQNGRWTIVRYAATGAGTRVVTGSTTMQAMYELIFTLQNHQLSLSINGLVVATGVAVDPAYIATDAITLDLDGQPGSAAARPTVAMAIFANFVYTPLLT